MSDIYNSNLYRICWQNPTDKVKQVLIVEVKTTWTWDDAYTIIAHANEILETVEGRCYSILHISETSQKAMDDSFAFAHIEKIIRMNPFKEEQIYMVGKIKALKNAIFVVERVLQLFERTSKLHYVDSIQDALEEIDDYESRLQHTAD